MFQVAIGIVQRWTGVPQDIRRIQQILNVNPLGEPHAFADE